MPRPLRIEYEGALYHVMSRGDRREAIFLEDADRDGFLRTLEGYRGSELTIDTRCSIGHAAGAG
jgi:hypothetical protein